LKNKDGVIDLDVPVEGDLDNPKFSVWDAIRDVIVNTVTKAVTAPFKLLGSLVGFGGDGDELSYVGYAAGSSELSDAEKEKVVKLGEALNVRPQLKLDVRGGADPEADGVAIRESKFKALVADRIAADPKKYAPPPGVETSPRLLKDLYIERFGKDAAKALEQKFQIPELDKEGKPKKNKTVLDDKAYYEDIRRALVDLESVDELELQTLAVTRGRSVKEFLVSGAGIVETRIFLVDVNTESGAREGVIRTELTLSD
jgi:hypothetical protein